MLSIETDRIIIRKPESSDFESLYQIHSCEETNRFNPNGPVKDRLDFKKTFDAWLDHHEKYHFGYYTLIEKEDKQVFGVCGLKVTKFKNKNVLNIYYRISPTKTQKDYVKEAAKAIMDFVLDKQKYQLPVVAITLANNMPSRQTAESLGFLYDPSLDNYQGNGNVYYFYDTKK